MARTLSVIVLGCLLFCIGTVALFLLAWAMAAAGGGDLVTPIVAFGLAILTPGSFLAAGIVFPGPARQPFDLIACPSCGATTAIRTHVPGSYAPGDPLPPWTR